jgi:FkbH-like protein
MTLNRALSIIRDRRLDVPAKQHFLVCGFEPLHLATFLHARLLERLPDDSVEVQTGLYGDLVGNFDLAANSSAIAAVAVLEWSDIDPRLGLRSTGGWSARSKQDIVANCQERFRQLLDATGRLAAHMPVAVAPPSLPLPPIGNTIQLQAGSFELELEQQLACFLLQLARIPNVRVVRSEQMGALPAGVGRLDAKLELLAGFPYSLPYASALARSLVDVLYQKPPKKGLITDLDDTIWSGIVGEIGVDAVCWHQEGHAQLHGLYQQMLGYLADCGVLLAVCSKNDSAVVQAALARKDLLITAESLFPVCAGWEPKSAAVSKILRTWNISASDVVFIDDSVTELAEVQNAFPEITCLRFPANDPASLWRLLGEMRDLFGKPAIVEEDHLRLASIRASSEFAAPGGALHADFLRGLQGTITVDYRKNPADRRPLELINKTNQFNVNGLRISEGDWQRLLSQDHVIVAVVSYQDRFGPLGRIAVLVGEQHGKCIRVSHWVMSCRAFSRRIEHHTLDTLFRRTKAEEIEFAFQATERNQLLREFFDSIGVSRNSSGPCRLSYTEFSSRCDHLPHEVSESLR